MAGPSVPPVTDPDVLAQVVAILTAHAPAKVKRPSPARDSAIPRGEAA